MHFFNKTHMDVNEPMQHVNNLISYIPVQPGKEQVHHDVTHHALTPVMSLVFH